MHEKKQKTKQKEEMKKHVFEIHTMEGDNENKKFISQVDVAVKKSKFVDTKKEDAVIESQEQIQQTQIKSEDVKLPVKPVNYIKQTNTTENPFLDTKKLVTPPNPTKKGSFAPNGDKSDVEKINKSPKDMLIKDEKISEIELTNKQKSKKKNSLGSIIIVVVLIVVIGLVAFMLYSKKDDVMSLVDKYTKKTDLQGVVNDDAIKNDMVDNDVIADDLDDQEIITQLYSSEFPNYFSVDVESETSQEDITAELTAIGENMKTEGIGGPISFIVTDINNNPVSFNVFAMSAGMDIPQDIMTALEENFEIYAFDDIDNGIRFGFIVDTKDSVELQTALTANEALLPNAFNIVLNGLGATTIDSVFGDSTYETHPIRFDNLDEGKTYSVDYTINDKRWMIGTSKNTMRAIIDYSKREKNQEDIVIAEEALTVSTLSAAIRHCDVFAETFIHQITGEEMKRNVLGMEDGMCLYEEEMPNGTKMKCKYSEELILAVAGYHDENMNSESNSIINGQEIDDILQYTIEEGHCIVYDIDGNEMR
ncbi:MAG: hypothetical protein ACKUBY_02305 [Candidatus Moraniibacteriota bacterium]